MGLFDWAKGQFVEIIEWQDASRDTVLWRFPVYRNEIKYGAQLTVREGQIAVFLNEGTVADVFSPGRHELTTKNLPVLATLKGWKYGFASPFKAEVVFANTRRFGDLKWGTLNPVMLRDQDFGVLRLRAFGTYALVVTDGKNFVGQHAGTAQQLLVSDLQEHLRNKIVARFSDSVAESKIPALDLSAKYDELSADLLERLNAELAEQGLGLTDLHVENISLPPEVEQALDARSKMAVLGDLGRYTQLQAAEALPTAAANQGLAGAGVGMGVGVGMGAAMGHHMAGALMPPNPHAPPDVFSPQSTAAGAGAASVGAASAGAAPSAATPSAGSRFCGACGTKAVEGSKFCTNCGAKLG